MGHRLHGYRIVYGQAIFVTFSPNEKDSLLMIRLSRTRASDPVHSQFEAGRKWGTRDAPSIEHTPVEFAIYPEELASLIPDYEERRSILAWGPAVLFRWIPCTMHVGHETPHGDSSLPTLPTLQ